MKNRAVQILLLSFMCSAAAGVSDEAYSRLINAGSLKCEFGPGTHAEWEEGRLVVGDGRFGPPGKGDTIHYDSIDTAARKARVIGTGGSSDLEVITDRLGLTLIEQIPLGGMAVTTIYGTYDANKAFPAVISKHVEFLGPLPQQYYGSCVVWD